MYKVIIPLYLGVSFFLCEFAHSWYIKEDPVNSGNLALGLPFLHHRTISYKIGYVSAIAFGIVTFLALFFVISFRVPSMANLTFEEFLRHYFVWILAPLIAMLAALAVVGASASKGVLALTAIATSIILFYASCKDATLRGVLAIWKDSWPVYALLAALGAYWITVYQRQKLERKRKDTGWAYRAPVLYFYGMLFIWLLCVPMLLSILLVFVEQPTL
jgi:hypothetical protein